MADDSAENRGPALEISMYVMVVVSLVFLALRCFCKARYRKPFAADDYILVVSWVFLAIYAGVIVSATKYGIGRHYNVLSHEDTVRAHLLLGTADFFAITSIAISKSSFAVTLLRLAIHTWHRAFIWTIIVTVNLALWTTAIFIFTSCSPIERIWDPLVPGTCWNARMLLDYNIFSGAWSAAMDFVLALFPWLLIMRLNMRRVEKIGVCVAMSLGVLSGVTAIIKTSYINQSAKWRDWTYLSIDLLIWAGAESAVVITAASIPFLRLALREVRTRSGSGKNNNNSGSHGGGGGGGHSHQLHSMASGKKNNKEETSSVVALSGAGGGGGHKNSTSTSTISNERVIREENIGRAIGPEDEDGSDKSSIFGMERSKNSGYSYYVRGGGERDLERQGWDRGGVGVSRSR
ncbi:hypothetical protein B0H63DRAFT_561409 [Podospora didyma]|uniref:Rhodopsin domain-containing protein n=1 Tax=Podospora didyma TaxID=330526 RepID=A0AAE0TW66_9PEZI|nr:hypothetical protein B0H63DRAFT_561409 [Podospora didyma]